VGKKTKAKRQTWPPPGLPPTPSSPTHCNMAPPFWLTLTLPFALPSLARSPGSLGYDQPGVPPQCFEEWQCVFQRKEGLPANYVWDLRPLCKGAGREFIANKDPACVSTGQPTGWTCPSYCGNCDPTNSNIRFNVCGTVSDALAPVNEEDPSCQGQPGGINCPQELPIPHSHGVGIQLCCISPLFSPAGSLNIASLC